MNNKEQRLSKLLSDCIGDLCMDEDERNSCVNSIVSVIKSSGLTLCDANEVCIPIDVARISYMGPVINSEGVELEDWVLVKQASMIALDDAVIASRQEKNDE